MEIVDFNQIKKNILGCKIPKPLSGTISGHAAGEPFDKFVFSEIKKNYSNTYRQFEFLNDLYLKNLGCQTFEDRQKLISSKSLRFLLNRGVKATKDWTSQKQFHEKQNDTADIIVLSDNFLEIIDIKTKNLSKDAQPPNIISSYKLAKACALVLENNEFEDFSIRYFGLDWILENDFLICKDIHFADLFRANPEKLYINWAAAMQIQFKVEDLDQSFDENLKEWAILYLKHYVKGTMNRVRYMENKFASPFMKYVL